MEERRLRHTLQPEPGFADRVRDNFARQPFMRLIGAELTRVEPGRCEMTLVCREELRQQNGYLHGGVIAALCDNVSGYAALSLMPPGANVLAVEFKINFLEPVRAGSVSAVGEVIRAGRTLSVVRADVKGVEDGEERRYAAAQQTVIRVPDRDP